jgi:hypothetical protein
MDLLKKYIISNIKFLSNYIGFTVLFFIVNFLFFRNQLDAPVDLIFTVFYIFVAPATILLYIFLKDELSMINNRYIYFFINILIPFLITLVLTMIYWVIEMQNSANLSQILMINTFSLPLMFLVIIGVILLKIRTISIFKILTIGLFIFVVYLFVLSGLSRLEMIIEDSIYTNIGYTLLFIVIPFGYMIYLIKRIEINLQ